ncbi:hypothetical protein GPD31_004274 [Salmonella enterica]|nr:hypothetical protein [Salmonella enterica]
MNKSEYVRAVRTLSRVAFFSLVTAPSLMMFVLFITLTFNNSIAGSFLSTARSLIDGAPDGMVINSVCDIPKMSPDDLSDEKSIPSLSDEKSIPSLSAENSVSHPGSPMYLATCHPGLKKASEWQKETDSTIRQFILLLYLLSVVMGLIVSWLFSGALPLERSFFRGMKS